MTDLRYAVRTLLKSPGFTLVAVLTLALGIGANTAMFAVVNAVLLKPLPFRDAERLMLVHLLSPDPERGAGIQRESVWSYPKYRSFLEVQQAFDSTALFSGRDFSLAGGTNPERVRGEVITDRYPAILGVAPIFGRSFTGEETHRPGAPAVALIGHSLWMRRYGSDPAILGRTIQVNATPYTVVGVLPPGFSGLSGNAEIWVPLAIFEPLQLDQRYSYSHSYYLVARRKGSVTEQSAMSAVRFYGVQVDRSFPNRFPRNVPWGASAASLYASRADADVRRASVVLFGAVGFVLLIACVNLTNLFMAKAIARRREVAVRIAMGASRLRIARQFLIESLVLAASGAALGVILAVAVLQSAATLLPESDVFFRSSVAPGVARISGAAGLTRITAATIDLDGFTLLFTFGVVVCAGIFVALVPALQIRSLRPIDAIKAEGGAGTARGFRGFGTRALLVTAQIALALVLLAGAGLMLKSASRLGDTAIGVNPQGVLTARVDLPAGSYKDENGSAFFAQLLEGVRAVPGVESAGLGNCPPVSGGCNSTSLWFPPRRQPGVDPLVGVYWATPDYFTALRIQLLQGRNFSDQDRTGRPKVVLVSEEAARAFWPNDTPLGKIVAVGQGGFHEGAEVIGVVSNVRYRAIEAVARPDVYIPVAQSYQSRMRLFVRSRLDPQTLAAAIRREVQALDPNLPLIEVKTMYERVGDAMWRTRVGAWLFSAFAALALLLTAIGIFGVMAQTVTQRTPEIGIRMALGAQTHEVLGLVLRNAALLAGGGIALGTGCAILLTRVMKTLLYEVEPGDPSTLAVVALILSAVALAACYLPARRAARVDPLVALRYE